MGTSIIEEQRNYILNAIRETSGNDWKVLVVDETSKKLLYNAAKEDDVLNCNITNIEVIEQRRESQPDTDAIYLLSPLPHIVQALKADISRRRYKRSFLIWTSALPRQLKEDLGRSESIKRFVAKERNLNIDFYPRESHLVTFREPWSFHILYHPACDMLVKHHLDSLTQKIVSVCVSLGEYPLVKYYRPRNPRHDASVLSSHLATFVQQALDDHSRVLENNYPPEPQSGPNSPPPRPRAVLVITDRSMDLVSPFVHELTYQAMAMDLLPVQDDGDRITYRNVIRRGQPDQEEKVVEINENDRLWVEHRHMHMKDLLVKLSEDFKRFQAKNAHFGDNDGEKITVGTIQDMIAGLPEFQEAKELFSLHIDMAEKCAKMFADRKLLDLTSVEQSLATGTDEDGKKPKNLADQLVRLLDDDSIVHEDRLRLLILYILYRNGILAGDIEKLRCHGQLSPMDGEIIYNLDTLGARAQKHLQDTNPPPPPLFAPRVPQNLPGEEMSLSRFEPHLRYMLEELCQNTLDPNVFPAVRPHLDSTGSQPVPTQTSLRSVNQPTWARTRPAVHKPRQRLIIFMAGGATYAEARACYDISQQTGKEVFLATTHMTTPKAFLRQVGLLSSSRKQLGLPMDQAPPQVPAWMSDPPPQALQPKPEPPRAPNGRTTSAPAPPTNAMQNMTLAQKKENTPVSAPQPNHADPAKSSFKAPTDMDGGNKLKKEKKEKKHFGMFKKH